MTKKAYLADYCNHTPQTLSWDDYSARIKNVLVLGTRLSCQQSWIKVGANICDCECHKPGTDAYEIQKDAMPFGFDNPIAHELIYHNHRHAQIQKESAAKTGYCQALDYGLNNLYKGTVQTTLNSIVYIWQQKLAKELIQMWHELNEEMRIAVDNNGEGWECVYRDMRTIERIMWNNHILRPDPVDGFLLDIVKG